MPETKPKKSANSKVFDVAKPGKSAPTASSRPIITTSGPIMKDPMVTKDGDAADGDQAPSLTSVRSHKIVVQPLNPISTTDEAAPAPGAPELSDDKAAFDPPKLPVEEVADEPAEDTDDKSVTKVESEAAEPVKGVPLLPEADTEEEPAKPAEESVAEEAPVEAPAVEPADTKEAKLAAESETSEETTSDTSSIPDDLPLADGAATESLSESDQKEALAAQKLAEEQEKIIESGTYYLPINAAHHRRSKRRFIIVLILVLVLLAVFALAAWDAEFISIPGYTAPTNYL